MQYEWGGAGHSSAEAPISCFPARDGKSVPGNIRAVHSLYFDGSGAAALRPLPWSKVPFLVCGVSSALFPYCAGAGFPTAAQRRHEYNGSASCTSSQRRHEYTGSASCTSSSPKCVSSAGHTQLHACQCTDTCGAAAHGVGSPSARRYQTPVPGQVGAVDTLSRALEGPCRPARGLRAPLRSQRPLCVVGVVRLR